MPIVSGRVFCMNTPQPERNPSVMRQVRAITNANRVAASFADAKARRTMPSGDNFTVEQLTEVLAAFLETTPFRGTVSGNEILFDVAGPTAAEDGDGRTFTLQLVEHAR